MADVSRIHVRARRGWWRFCHFLCFCYFWPMYRYRAWGQHHIPDTGPVLLLSNHQSLYDPILVGLACHKRTFWAMARKTLFDVPVLGWLIRSLNAISVDQEASDIQSIRSCVEVLKKGQALVIFPEGERTATGEINRFEPGTLLLIKRAKPTIVPVALDGSYEVWPRTRRLPKPTGQMGVFYGQPIAAQTLVDMPGDQALEHLRQTIEDLREALNQRMHPEASAGSRYSSFVKNPGDGGY